MTEDAELLDSSSVLTFVILRLTFPTHFSDSSAAGSPFR